MASELSKRTLTGEIIGVNKFEKGDFAYFTEDFTTFSGDEVLVPKGAKVYIDGVEFHGAEYANTPNQVIVWIKYPSLSVHWRMCVEGKQQDNLVRFEPDEFDRAWLTCDYDKARAIYDGKE